MYQVFAIPYAGGSAISYAEWKRRSSPPIEFIPIELAGRGERVDELFYRSLQEAVIDIHQRIVDRLGPAPFAIYGHSMGALLAFEVAYHLCEFGRPPSHLFVSGGVAPQRVAERPRKILHALDDRLLIDEIMAIGGTPQEVFEHEELTNLLLPIFRADLRIVETYQFESKEFPLPCDITVFYGDQENISFEEATAWQEHSSKTSQVYRFPGDHFFIRSHEDALLSHIRQRCMMGGWNR